MDDKISIVYETGTTLINPNIKTSSIKNNRTTSFDFISQVLISNGLLEIKF